MHYVIFRSESSQNDSFINVYSHKRLPVGITSAYITYKYVKIEWRNIYFQLMEFCINIYNE